MLRNLGTIFASNPFLQLVKMPGCANTRLTGSLMLLTSSLSLPRTRTHCLIN